ncbi:DEAD/DEAH box helicase [Tepidiforma bonchosmolovskayae]|uniref:DEAD/DEAH box helicase n=1 Tax=Tepidiforma bonchosmolovskayae TaxID=2601677 RepID=A0ABX6C0I0_9CHLR|nr:DEAD/DEAH box helicase [Tepidiforma bonchosmolovskayae]QFG02722.1 DEAD/DEAH box helicase [Tepidiforma bonchosmolovskayae]
MSATNNLDPLRATGEVETAYRRYLRTSLRSNDPQLNRAIEEAFDRVRTPWLKGPFLEASQNYQHGVTPNDLVREGVLSPRWLESNGGFSIHRPLYRHQETAIRKLVTERRNVVVATGTGSGKTESFLLPIINQIFREQEQGSLRSGVRALLLYPMNALANDQLKRLRELLEDFPEVTFGRYTGDTPETRAEGIEKAKNSGVETILPNEMFGRQEMRERPPHLLLTNYAMLEYLLIRPDDSPLFAVSGDNEWRFIVLDEVHSYEGTMGLEIGMLLRRLLDRVGRGPGKTQAIATSATAGGPEDRKQIAKFASDLFGLPFECDDDDPARQDVIVASREAPRLPAPGPRIDLEQAVRTGNSDALLADPRVQDLLTSLGAKQLTLEEAAAMLGDADPFELTASVVRALSSLRDPQGLPLLRAKYHTFVRSPDGMFVCLRDHDGGPRVFLESARHCDICGPAAMVIEVATCRRCGQWHLRGTVSGDERSGRLQAALNLPDSSREVLFLGPKVAEDPVDEPEEPGQLVELVLQGEKRTNSSSPCVSPACGPAPAGIATARTRGRRR